MQDDAHAARLLWLGRFAVIEIGAVIPAVLPAAYHAAGSSLVTLVEVIHQGGEGRPFLVSGTATHACLIHDRVISHEQPDASAVGDGAGVGAVGRCNAGIAVGVGE